MKTKYRITTLCLAIVMVVGILFAGSASTVSAASDPANAPVDWAFEASSVELNDAVIQAYPALDNGNGFVTKTAANAMTGQLNLASKNITGTMNGVENFINLQSLKLSNNKISGEIPQLISNLTNVEVIMIDQNQLTGSIPSSLGDLNNLKFLSLYTNQLSGTIPDSLGNLTLLETLDIPNNLLTGSIPSSLGNLSNLENLSVHKNQLTGDIPTSIYSLPSLTIAKFHSNSNLTGNPATGFASSTTINYLDIRGTSLIQASPEIATLGYTVGTFLYDNLADELLIDSKTSLAANVTQDTIVKAQESADFISDVAMKQQWQDDIDLAQKMLNAKNKADNLLTIPDLANLKDGVDKAKVDEAQDLVTTLPNGALKDDLQAKIDTANNLLDAKEKVAGLVNPDGSLATGVDQGKIGEAQDAVNKLPNGVTKIELQKIIDEVQNQLNQKNVVIKPSTKPTISGGDTVSSGAVSTGDTTNTTILYALLAVSLLGLVVIIKRIKVQK